ncbi:MAG: hypothetical protein IKM38_06580 [Christensenellaceae bacterium]|nr:hypothetical protein [Christensenellaceae bacterium]
MISINTNMKLRHWPEIARYQCTSLNNPPKSDFPAHWEALNGRPKIVRLTAKIDDLWDYRTDEYFWDYQIGSNRYGKDPVVMDMMDKGKADSSFYPAGVRDVRYMEHLLSYAGGAEEVILFFRRYERAVVEGFISIEKYGEVIRTILEHHKELCPNIKYVEINEPDCDVFGNLTMFEFYPFYKQLYKAVNTLNKKHQYEVPIQVGGPCLAFAPENFEAWEQFIRLYMLDDDPEKRLDYYSYHDYNSDTTRLGLVYEKHKKLAEQMGLKASPVFVNEFGAIVLADAKYDRALENATGIIRAMLMYSKYEDMHIFPWCSMHDPVAQRSLTQFIRGENGEYIPTPCGHAMRLMNMLKGTEVKLEGADEGMAAAVCDGSKTRLLITNCSDRAEELHITIELSGGSCEYEEYRVDKNHNNYYTDSTHRVLEVTKRGKFALQGSTVLLETRMEPYSFALWEF